jgi:exopolyphosphatase/guanosine-5'-triphosphate,3'-diphosphate pyrophosphatase
MRDDSKPDTYAAVDLGSNSFHMLVARREHGELRVLDRIKEMVRLGGGLDNDGNLDPEVRQRALECLSRFGQRLRGIPEKNMRAVGTQSFRRMKDAKAFLLDVEGALECPVEIIAGREEARLVYLGVSQWITGQQQKQLVMDIGGGSTEMIIGVGVDPIEMESMQFGCVSVTNRFFADGKINAKRLKKAHRAVAAELQEIQSVYRKAGWQVAIGSSGTFRSAAIMCELNGWCKKGITLDALQQLRRVALRFRTIDDIQINGLSERRKPVFIGGLAIMLALFKTLSIQQILVSPYALREGLLQDLLGRLEQRDPRDKAVKAFMTRFAVDLAQVERVRKTALDVFDQLAGDPSVGEAHRRMVGWAADLHETGLNLSHASYQAHSAYLVEASDMAGFSRQEQLFLAALVGFQRREIPATYADKLPARMRRALSICLLCIRLAWIFCRTREDKAIPKFSVELDADTVRLTLPAGWKDKHPLTIADLQFEEQAVQTIGLRLETSFADHDLHG